MRYFISDCKQLYHSKIAWFTWAVLAILTILGPFQLWQSHGPLFLSEADHPYMWWMLMGSGLNANVFYTLLHAWPVLCTGLVFTKERLSSVEMLMTARKGRISYLLSKECSVFLITFLHLAVLLLLNVCITNCLYQSDLPLEAFREGLMRMPTDGSFGAYLYQYGYIMAQVGYSLLMALYLALLSALTVSIQMIFPLRNIYLAFLIPIILFECVYFVLEHLLIPGQPLPSIFLQPMAASAFEEPPTLEHVIIGFLALILVCLASLALGLFRNRDTL